MGAVIGEVLPLAVGVAVSPIPIVAVILMLLAPKAGATSLGFLLGWAAGIVVATALFVWLAATTGLASGGEPSAAASWVKLGIGVLLALLGIKQWRSRPAPGERPQSPKWMAAVDRFTLGKAAGLGFALAAVNPKNLLMCVAAGVAIGGAGLGAGGLVAASLVFVVIAASTVAVPVVGYAVAAERMRGPLDRLKVWLQAENAAVMSVLLLVIAAVMIGKGLGGLW